jgi:LAS superfamily LD-carboxypeptidase LdcB
MAIEAVSAVRAYAAGTAAAATPAPPDAVSVNAGGMRSVTLAQMLTARLESGPSANGLGLPGQTATITSTNATTTTTAMAASLSAAAANASGTATNPTLGAMDPPPEMVAYGNGRLPRELLTPIGIGQHRLWAPAAQQFVAMRTSAAQQGVSISVTDSYRNYDSQVELAARKGLSQNGGLAAVPGTSEHGWGLAVDMDVNGAGMAWLKANGGTYGWVQPTTREPWHWEFHGLAADTPTV